MATQGATLSNQPHHNGSVSGPLSDLKIAEPYIDQTRENADGEHHTGVLASQAEFQTAAQQSPTIPDESNLGYGHFDPNKSEGLLTPTQDRHSDMHYAPIHNAPAMGQVCRYFYAHHLSPP